jgi:hypothetical protein
MLYVGALARAEPPTAADAARATGIEVHRRLVVLPAPDAISNALLPFATTTAPAAATGTGGSVQPMLLLHDVASSAGGGAGPSSAPGPTITKPTKLRKPRSHKMNYYICTKIDCGWSGCRPKDHVKVKPMCTGYPSTVYYDKRSGSGAREAAAEFLARCTPRQRELGLPPDYAKPVPQKHPDGTVDESKLYLTVPIGLVPGDCFTVPTGRGLRATVIVPEGLQEGDVLAIHPSSGTRRVGEEEAAGGGGGGGGGGGDGGGGGGGDHDGGVGQTAMHGDEQHAADDGDDMVGDGEDESDDDDGAANGEDDDGGDGGERAATTTIGFNDGGNGSPGNVDSARAETVGATLLTTRGSSDSSDIHE